MHLDSLDLRCLDAVGFDRPGLHYLLPAARLRARPSTRPAVASLCCLLSTRSCLQCAQLSDIDLLPPQHSIRRPGARHVWTASDRYRPAPGPTNEHRAQRVDELQELSETKGVMFCITSTVLDVC
jgi:hypothetical protein